MPIELKTQRDGSLRDTWYGRYEINGKRFYLNLSVKWAGTPPESRSLRDTGDSLFERSRATALAKLDSIVLDGHPRLKKFHLCVPSEFPDARKSNQTSSLVHWERHRTKWAVWGKQKGVTVEFEAWTEHAKLPDAPWTYVVLVR